MMIKSAQFVTSCAKPEQHPNPDKPEYAFVGRSNVGKSSLINYLCDRKKLAKTSVTPGKTRLINYFLINENWYLVDLPGYGYAKVAKTEREKWNRQLKGYLKNRSNLMSVFLLIDSRLKAQKSDLEFMNWMGEQGIPFVLVFTKIDKLGSTIVKKNIEAYKVELLKSWEELPPIFFTSSHKKTGGEALLTYIEKTNTLFRKN